MWCSPDLLQSKEGYAYDVLAHNEFFELHHCKKVSTTIDLFKDIVMLIPNKIIPHKENEHHQNTFHIVLKGERQYVVAVGSSKEEIEIKWKWIEDEIIPTIKQYKSNNIKDAQALLDFLLVKFDSMTKIQDKETIELRSEEFNKLFNLKNEILVSNYPCNLYKIGKGELYLSENYICFISNESKENQEKVIIPFREISIIKKRSWLQNPAISISTKKKNEYYWSGFHHNVRDEAFGVIEQLWHQTLTKILKSVDIISNFHSNPSSHSAKQEPVFDIQSLEKTQASMRYNRLLRLPLCEKHIFEVAARTWEGRSEKSGQLFISNYFISFQTKTGKPYRVSVPFREIFNIAKEDKMIGGNSKAIKVIGRNRRYIFLFDSVSDRNNAYDNSIDRWNKAVLECDFLSFLPVSCSPPQVGMGELLEDRREFTSTYIEKQMKVEPFWMNYCIKHGRGCGMVEDMEFLQHLLRQGGIPDRERSWLWPLFSGATNKAHSAPTLGYYQSLLFSHSGDVSKAMDEIEKDLLRSFPEHPHFLTEQGIKSLRNVLTAYSRRNPTLGYCQSMNIIAAFLLCYLEEEVAFWTLAAICEDLAPENYDKNMIGSIVDVQAFEDLLARFLPQISTQMKAFNIPVTVITQGWFLCLFVGYLPLEATLRTLDNFFFSRGKMLFATALAIFKCCEQRILSAKEPDELMVLLKDLHDVMKDEEMMSLLLKTAYDFVEMLDSDRLLELKGFQKFKAVKEVEKSTRNNTIRAVLERGTKFELHELHRLYEYYYSEASSTDFLINLDQFSNIIIKILPWMRWRIDLIPPFFRTLDRDHDGVVDFFAFIDGIFTVVSNENLREKLRFYFILHDTDNDGLLDKGDYYKVLDAIARSFFDEHVRETDLNCLVNWTFEQADKDHDQRISFDGVSNLLLSAEEDGEDNNVNSNDDQLGLLEHFLKL